MSAAPLLDVRNLSIAFAQGDGTTLAVDNISFALERGKTLALVGESGSGKSITSLSIVRLLMGSATHPSGEVFFKGQDLLKADPEALRKVRGNDITMVFQEPMTSLNPLHTIEQQVAEILELHGMSGRDKLRARVIELLDEVGIPDPAGRLTAYPHQMSGGQSQRVMIAMAIATNPRLLIADEPTTALDVTIQKQILDLLMQLQEDTGMALILITHDMGVVAETADRVQVQYKGKKMEEADVLSLFEHPKNPYTRALLSALPENATGDRLSTVASFMDREVQP